MVVGPHGPDRAVRQARGESIAGHRDAGAVCAGGHGCCKPFASAIVGWNARCAAGPVHGDEGAPSWRAREEGMTVRLKPIMEQTVVITGASSGIGRAAALLAAARGARVVAVARNEHALGDLVEEIGAKGGRAIHVVADVADAAAMDRVARVAIEVFGGFDTWVNDAGVGLYGRLDEIHLEDKRRLFDVVFWGVVHGCRSALPHLRARGGAIINIGSVESDVALPLSGPYAAAKQAVKAYTDVLRLELAHDHIPVSVTLVKPSGIDTPFFRHARSYLGVEPKAAPPVYAPEVVAAAILHAAAHPVRDITIGAGGKALSTLRKHAPRLSDRVREATQFGSQTTDRPVPLAGTLYEPADDAGAVHGDYPGHVMQSSAYTTARLHPLATAALLAGVGIAAMAGARSLGRGD